jgi:hypothetical protein
MRKSTKWDWTGRCQDSFEVLKQKLIEAPLLRTPNERLPYKVVMDASDLGLGAVLLQEGHPVAFESRKLNSAELNYNVTEKEMLAVMHALRVWRCYLEGADITVYTDHVSNTFFHTQPNLSRRQARWSEFLHRFGAFEWKYCKGASNVADALSQRDVAGSVWRYVRLRNIPRLQIWYRQSRATREVPRRATPGPDSPDRHMSAPSSAGRHLLAPTSVPIVGTRVGT